MTAPNPSTTLLVNMPVPVPADMRPWLCPCVWERNSQCDVLAALKAEAGPSGISPAVIVHVNGASAVSFDLRREVAR